MSKSTKQGTKYPLFPKPIEQEYPGSDVEGSSYGHCAAFCTSGNDRGGMLVEDHGGACDATIGGSHLGVDNRGDVDGFMIELNRPYLHGRYDPDELRQASNFEAVVTLFPVAEYETERALHLTAPVARSLAAALIRAADIWEQQPR